MKVLISFPPPPSWSLYCLILTEFKINLRMLTSLLLFASHYSLNSEEMNLEMTISSDKEEIQ